MAGLTPAIVLYGPLRYARLRFAAGCATAVIRKYYVRSAVWRDLMTPWP